MEVQTGAIVALVSSPGFDPNLLVPPVDRGIFNALKMPEAGKPFLNRACREGYPLGSVFKVVTGLSGVEEGVVDAARMIECTGRFSQRYRNLRCGIYVQNEGASHGPLDLFSAMECSCNIYFYQTAVDVGPETLIRWARRLGFGERTGIDGGGEYSGNLPEPGQWPDAEVASLGIGQGRLSVTPIQVVCMMAAVATGKRIRPRFVLREGVEPIESGAHPEALELIREGLRRVVSGAAGTARGVGLNEVGMAGKTGSAQSGAGRPAHAWFAGYFPFSRPRYAVVVLVEYGGAGGKTAAPIAATVARAVVAGEGER
jgi:penicillin-binding protein 2